MDGAGTKQAKVLIEGASKVYPAQRGGEGVVAYEGVNLEIRDGEFVCLVGPSGCGKTTLLKTVAGLVRATSGHVQVDNRRVVHPGPDRAMVFQDAALLPWRNVRHNIAYGLDLAGVARRDKEGIVAELIELVGLEGFGDALPHELSGGMQQRVNVARALAVNPSILLMDEPFAALDAQTREVMQLELLRIWHQHRRTVLFVTHQIDEAVYLADRVAVMAARPGRVTEVVDVPFGRPRDFALKREYAFTDVVRHVWSLIEKQVMQTAQT